MHVLQKHFGKSASSGSEKEYFHFMDKKEPAASDDADYSQFMSPV